MTTPVRWTITAATFAAMFGIWLLSEHAKLTLGFDPGGFGTAVLSLVGCGVLLAMFRTGAPTLGKGIAPGEMRAWIGVAFMVALLGYFVSHLDLFVGVTSIQSTASQEVGRQMALLVIGWIVVSAIATSLRRDEIREDERDREIDRGSADLGRSAVVAMVMILAVLISFSPAERLEWATHVMIGVLLIVILMIGTLIENATSAVRYWRDRH